MVTRLPYSTPEVIRRTSARSCPSRTIGVRYHRTSTPGRVADWLPSRWEVRHPAGACNPPSAARLSAAAWSASAPDVVHVRCAGRVGGVAVAGSLPPPATWTSPSWQEFSATRGHLTRRPVRGADGDRGRAIAEARHLGAACRPPWSYHPSGVCASYLASLGVHRSSIRVVP